MGGWMSVWMSGWVGGWVGAWVGGWVGREGAWVLVGRECRLGPEASYVPASARKRVRLNQTTAKTGTCPKKMREYGR